MVLAELKTKQAPELEYRLTYRQVVARFLVTWLGFLVILLGIALLYDINWARPHVQKMMSAFFHRQVKLGKLSWSLGFNGLAVNTNKLQVTDTDGKPFLKAAASEIGIAFIPLLTGNMQIRYLSFNKPELWAIRLSKNRWNFSDLLQAVEIHFIEVKDGELHVLDRLEQTGDPLSADTSRFQPYNFSNIQLKLIWPRKDRKWPVYLCADLSRPGYITKLKVSAIGRGLLRNWQQEIITLEASASNLNLQDLGPYRQLVPPINGLVDLKISASGKLSQEVKATANTVICDLPNKALKAQASSVPSKRSWTTVLCSLPGSTATAQLLLNQHHILWKDLEFKAANVLVHSQGEIRPCLAKANKFHTHQSVLETTGKHHLPEWWPLKDLCQSAQYDISLNGAGSNDGTRGTQLVQLTSMPLPACLPDYGRAWLQAACQDPSSRIRGQFDVDTSGGITARNIELSIAGIAIRLTGSWNKSSSSMKFASNDIDLRNLKNILLSNKDLAGSESRQLSLLLSPGFDIKGHVDVAGVMKSSNKQHELSFSSNIKSGQVNFKRDDLYAHDIHGKISFDGRNLHLHDLTGITDGGTLKVSGQIALVSAPHLDLVIRASHLDLEHLSAIIKLARVKLPILTEHQLFGKVHDLSLSIKGSGLSPEIELSAQPENLFYQPGGLAKPLRAVGGSIRYANDQLTLENVELVGKGNKLVTSMVIDQLSQQANLRKLKLKTGGMDLTDLHYYLSSNLMPAALRKAYLDFIAHNHITNCHGKAYGDLLWLPREKDFTLDGAVGFRNLGARFGPNGYPIEHLSGVIAASGNELSLQDIYGNVGHSTFALDGHISKYQEPSISWQTELRSSMYPNELFKLLPGLADQLKGHLLSTGPLTVRSTICGNRKASEIVFSSSAEPSNHLRLLTPLGTIYQPSGQAVKVDGSMTVSPGSNGFVRVHDSHLLIGNSLLQSYGQYRWFSPESNRKPDFEFYLLSPNSVPASTLVAILDPATKADGVKGSVSGNLVVAGELTNVISRGTLHFYDITLPTYNVAQLNGHIETPGWLLLSSQPESQQTFGSKAQLSLSTISVSGLTARNVKADILFGDSEPGTITLRNGSAEIAGGSVELNGTSNLESHRFQLNCKLKKVDSNEVSGGLLERTGEISGFGDADITLDSHGCDYKELIHNLDGYGTITISGGKVGRFGQLQEKLTQANLLHQGLFGFNLNNLLQTVVPIRTGQFRDLQSSFQIRSGILKVQDLRFNGDDMRLWAAGQVSLPLKTIYLEVAGKVPRVFASFVGGPVGQVSRHLTFQNFMHLATLHTLENFPSLPLLGDLASERPRTFVFKVTAPIDEPKSLAQSIEKSFHWLPALPNASAHPVPDFEN